MNRDYEEKKEAIVYNYVDSHIRVFDNMYSKRLHIYKRTGFQLITNRILSKQTVNSIYDSGNYMDVFERDIVEAEKYQLPAIPKTTLKNVDKCRDYILKFVLGYSRSRLPGEEEKTSEFDDWGIQFLPILFEGKSIELFNTTMYLETLKAQQDDEYCQIVQIIIFQNVLQ